jgi:hypothetical protein
MTPTSVEQAGVGAWLGVVGVVRLRR